MTWRKQECYLLICDSCGQPYDCGDFIAHFDKITPATEAFTDGGWVYRPDIDRHWCEGCIARKRAAIGLAEQP